MLVGSRPRLRPPAEPPLASLLSNPEGPLWFSPGTILVTPSEWLGRGRRTRYEITKVFQATRQRNERSRHNSWRFWFLAPAGSIGVNRRSVSAGREGWYAGTGV